MSGVERMEKPPRAQCLNGGMPPAHELAALDYIDLPTDPVERVANLHRPVVRSLEVANTVMTSGLQAIDPRATARIAQHYAITRSSSFPSIIVVMSGVLVVLSSRCSSCRGCSSLEQADDAARTVLPLVRMVGSHALAQHNMQLSNMTVALTSVPLNTELMHRDLAAIMSQKERDMGGPDGTDDPAFVQGTKKSDFPTVFISGRVNHWQFPWKFSWLAYPTGCLHFNGISSEPDMIYYYYVLPMVNMYARGREIPSPTLRRYLLWLLNDINVGDNTTAGSNIAADTVEVRRPGAKNASKRITRAGTKRAANDGDDDGDDDGMVERLGVSRAEDVRRSVEAARTEVIGRHLRSTPLALRAAAFDEHMPPHKRPRVEGLFRDPVLTTGAGGGGAGGGNGGTDKPVLPSTHDGGRIGRKSNSGRRISNAEAESIDDARRTVARLRAEQLRRGPAHDDPAFAGMRRDLVEVRANGVAFRTRALRSEGPVLSCTMRNQQPVTVKHIGRVFDIISRVQRGEPHGYEDDVRQFAHKYNLDGPRRKNPNAFESLLSRTMQ